MKAPIKKRNVLLILILTLFLVTRLYKITEVPASLYWDEASIGVNAYSILKTGQDEWGQNFPLHFKAFVEYKLPVYIYTVSLVETIFGLNEFSIRLPALLFSLGVVLLVYSISFKFFKNLTVSLFAAFLITISPWLFIFTRTGYEATAGLFFFLLGFRFWLSYQKSSFFIILSVASFILSIYSYNSFRVLLPLSLPLLFSMLLDKKKNHNLMISLILGFSLLIFASIPIIELFNKGEETRLSTIGIFDDRKKTIEIVKEFTKNYLLHFSPEFLFLNGDNNTRSQQKGFGELFIIEAPFLILSFFSLLKRKRTESLFLVYLLLVSFVPSAITKEAPHALRSILAPVIISMLSAYGIGIFYLKIKQFLPESISRSLYKIVIFAFLVFFSSYYLKFISSYNNQSANNWQYGYKKIFTSYQEEFSKFDNVVISDRYNQPYIFFLFYLKYDPRNFKKEVVYNASIKRVTSLVGKINKFTFTNIDFYNLPAGKSLIFSHPTDRMDEIKTTKIIRNPDGSPSVYVYEYQK